MMEVRRTGGHMAHLHRSGHARQALMPVGVPFGGKIAREGSCRHTQT